MLIWLKKERTVFGSSPCLNNKKEKAALSAKAFEHRKDQNKCISAAQNAHNATEMLECPMVT